MVYLIIGSFIFVALAFIYFAFAGITFKGLPVLMYHKVTDSGIGDGLTISTRNLERQFQYLVRKNYTPIHLSELLAHLYDNQPLPAKPLLITFDDGYKNNYTYLYPLLEKYHLKANIFLVAGFIQSSVHKATGENDFMHTDDLKNMNESFVQFGLHSYDHQSYNDLTISQIEEDIRQCKTRLNLLGVPYQPCLAYTYGAFPKKDVKKRNQMFRTMQANGIRCAFRIGNRVNKLPIKEKLLLQRIDVRGDESFGNFKLILAAGKKIFFK